MKTRLVLHTADWHLGKNRKYADYLDQQRLMLTTLLTLIKKYLAETEHDVWFIVAGDIFDRNEDTNREEFILPIMSILYALIELQTQNKRFSFYIIDGNHDRQPFDPTVPDALISVVSPFIKLLPENSIAVGNPVWLAQESLLLLPFNNYTEDGLISVIQKYDAQFVVAHECLFGISTDTGWKPPRDQDKYINIDNVIAECPRLVSIFMGDIHRSQKVDKGGICWYSGSLITLDHGHKMPKGVLIHTFEQDGDTWLRTREPYLQSLVELEPKLKVHKQLGVLTDLDNIPFDVLATYPDSYLQFIVSPEVHHEITKQLPNIFTHPQVAWEYVEEETQIKNDLPEETESRNILDYYLPLIKQWVDKYSVELTEKEKDKVYRRIIQDFSLRFQQDENLES